MSEDVIEDRRRSVLLIWILTVDDSLVYWRHLLKKCRKKGQVNHVLIMLRQCAVTFQDGGFCVAIVAEQRLEIKR